MTGRRRGYTLIEVVVSILLTAIMVSAVFSVALTSRSGGGKAERKLLATQASKTVGSVIKNYISADTTTTVIEGPNSARAGADKWKIHTPGVQEDRACTLTWNAAGTEVTDVTLGGVQDIYAMAPGAHCLVCVAASGVGCFLPKALREPPYNGILFYDVAGSPPLTRVGTFWREL